MESIQIRYYVSLELALTAKGGLAGYGYVTVDSGFLRETSVKELEILHRKYRSALRIGDTAPDAAGSVPITTYPYTYELACVAVRETLRKEAEKEQKIEDAEYEYAEKLRVAGANPWSLNSNGDCVVMTNYRLESIIKAHSGNSRFAEIVEWVNVCRAPKEEECESNCEKRRVNLAEAAAKRKVQEEEREARREANLARRIRKCQALREFCAEKDEGVRLGIERGYDMQAAILRFFQEYVANWFADRIIGFAEACEMYLDDERDILFEKRKSPTERALRELADFEKVFVEFEKSHEDIIECDREGDVNGAPEICRASESMGEEDDDGDAIQTHRTVVVAFIDVPCETKWSQLIIFRVVE